MADQSVMEPRLTLLTLGVRDLQRSIEFYRDGLGWRLSKESSEGVVAFLLTAGAVISLWPRADLAADAQLPLTHGDTSCFALAHNVREKHEVDLILEHAASLGARIPKAAEDTTWGGRAGYFQDPDGFLWEVAWNPFFPMGADGLLQLT